MTRLVLPLALLVAGCASAQPPPEAGVPTTSPVRPGDVSPALGPASEVPTRVERAVAATVAREGVHVVHFWAPWCGNSTAELESGWHETIEANPDVSFSFVTIWNDGRDGAETLRRYAIPDRVAVYAQPDHGPSAVRANRRTTFLGLPLSWTPTTWVFNRGGTLAYAFNYGEVSAEMLATAIEHARDEWTHD